jgi:hypothetical protein
MTHPSLWRISMEFTIALAGAALIGVASTGAEPPTKGRDKDLQQHIRDLVESLGNPWPEATTVHGDAYFVIPKAFDWKRYEAVAKTRQELLSLGVVAYPELVTHADDGRFCCIVDDGPVEVPRTVGAICKEIINCQIEVFPYDCGVVPPRGYPSSVPGNPHGLSTQSMDQWWQASNGKVRLEMQIAAAEYALTAIKAGKVRLTSEDIKAANIKQLEEFLQNLNSSKMSKPPREFYGRIVHGRRSDAKEKDGELRIYYEGGK